MYEVSNNFALAIRLHNLYVSHSDMAVNLYRCKRGAAAFTAHFRAGGLPASSIDYMDEREAFARLHLDAPWALDAARMGESLYYRGLARRAELMNSMSEPAFDALMAEFNRVPMLMWDTVLAQFGGRYRGKSKVKPRITATSKGVSWWEVRGKVALPQYPAEQSLSVRFFPSMVDDAWSMQVALPSLNADVIRHNQKVTREAMSELQARGVKLEDVVNGTLLCL